LEEFLSGERTPAASDLTEMRPLAELGLIATYRNP
jgi:hypothetical protein